MKAIVVTLVAFIVLSGCSSSSGSHRTTRSLDEINVLYVVIDNSLWDDTVGEAIRNIFAAPVPALIQEEPLFTINQIPAHLFSGDVTNGRIILKIDKNKPAGISINENPYTKPQVVVVLSGKTDGEIIEQISDNAERIIALFKKQEIAEKQRRINQSLFDDAVLKKEMGVSLNFPTTYRIAKHEGKFFLIRRDIATGTIDLMVYQVPISSIKKGEDAVEDVIRLKDSIGEAHIPGPVEGSYLITEEAYTPYLFETILDNKPAFETKGLWDVKHAFMSGPFINYAIEDRANKRYIVVEGYVFAPSVEKRDYIFEIEAIIKSIKIQ